MGMKVTDDDGNEIELPVDKVEELASLKEQAGKVTDLTTQIEELKKGQNPDWPSVRAQTKKLEADLKVAQDKLTAAGEKPPVVVDETKAKELSKTTAEEVVAASEAKKVEVRRDKLIKELAGGDDNKVKVIKEKYDQLTGGRKITDDEEMQAFLTDAQFLANKNKSGGGSTFDKVNGGSMGRTADRTVDSQSVEHGANLAGQMGYRPKSDVNKLVNKK